MKKEIVDQFRQFFLELAIIGVSAFLVYFVPGEFSRLFFILLLFFMWKSKNDYFWFAFILIIIDNPGGLFAGGGLEMTHRLPIFNLAKQISFTYVEVCLLLFLVKAIAKKSRSGLKSFAYKRQYVALFGYLIFLLLIAIPQGASFASLKNAYKSLISVSVYLSAIMIFSREEDVVKFFRLIFPFAFVAVLLQFYSLIFHQQLVALLEPGSILSQGVLDPEKFVRPIELAVVDLICFFGSLLYLNNKRKYFADKYLILVNVSSYISIFMTATRSWFLGFTVMYLIYLVLNFNRLKRNLSNIVFGVFFITMLFMLFPAIKKQSEQSVTRLRTIEMLVSGDISAGGTLSRFTNRGPRVLEGFKKSSILFGTGYSDLYFLYADGHVGFHNILLHSGIIGFILLMSFAFTLFSRPFKLYKKWKYRSDEKPILMNLPLLIPTVLIINSSTQFWGYNITEIQRAMMLAAYASISSMYMNKYVSSISKLLRAGPDESTRQTSCQLNQG